MTTHPTPPPPHTSTTTAEPISVRTVGWGGDVDRIEVAMPAGWSTTRNLNSPAGLRALGVALINRADLMPDDEHDADEPVSAADLLQLQLCEAADRENMTNAYIQNLVHSIHKVLTPALAELADPAASTADLLTQFEETVDNIIELVEPDADDI